MSGSQGTTTDMGLKCGDLDSLGIFKGRDHFSKSIDGEPSQASSISNVLIYQCHSMLQMKRHRDVIVVKF